MMLMPLSKTTLFVYDTLKKGGVWNHLLKHSDYIGPARTAARYPMVIQGIPYVLDKPSTGHEIQGEVYDVDGKTIQALDALEQHPRWFHRRLRDVLVAGERRTAYIYFLHEAQYSMLGERDAWLRANYHSTYLI